MLRRRHYWYRYRELAEILAHHGLFIVVQKLGLIAHLPWTRRIADRPKDAAALWPERVRMALTEMGPTFVKLGQLASTRSDVLPPELVAALESLQDEVPPFDPDQALAMVREAWGRPADEMLQEFSRSPLAAASVGQVHAGRLFDGRRVVIKIRRPGIIRQSAADFEILRNLARVAERRTEWAKSYDVVRLVDELIEMLREELDFTVEARNTERARRRLGEQADFRVPEVIWSLCRPDVLVMERLEGVKVSERETLRERGFDLTELARRFVESLYRQVFLDGFFHADPHPGNVHIDAQGRIVWLDWGLVGNFTREMRQRSVELIMGLIRGDSEQVMEALLGLGVVDDPPDRSRLLREVDRLRRRYYEIPLKDFKIGDALTDLFRVARQFSIRIPVEYMLLAKTAILADGVVRRLDPDVSLMELGKPFAHKIFLNRIDPRVWIPLLSEEVQDWGKLFADLPRDFQKTLRTVGQGEIRIVIEHKNLDRVMAHWEGLINQVSFHFLVGTFIIGSALVVQPSQLDGLGNLPIGEIAFILSAVLGVIAIVRSLRRNQA